MSARLESFIAALIGFVPVLVVAAWIGWLL